MEAFDITLLVVGGWVAILAFAVMVCAAASRADDQHEEISDLAASAPNLRLPAPSPSGFARSGREASGKRSRVVLGA